MYKKGNDMNRTTILTVGTSHLNATDEWGVVTALNAEAAIEKFHQVHVDLVVFTGNGSEDELKLRKLFLFHRPEIIFLQDKNDCIPKKNVEPAKVGYIFGVL